ncbi:class I SAM-dependent methyltransferase [uncultured Reyranella sp.]|jgi:2-polyprenyl-3-methyl-5-hydroxy-6-metoxy-1,4-benzoquinol methylase|uniref:class I SAM-dependent methyltransferase n=1 Tax=uncultured Reyranella sp. TaxID=735512 RepID=UPI00259D2576|nr:class I SAM-dependent methyltransferase [uncultured Reyranella sp.]
MDSAAYDYENRIPPGFYDRVYQRKSGVRYCWHDLKFRTVASHVGAPRRLLDIGCGPGTFIGNYLDGIEALGLDLSASQIGYATSTYGTAGHRFSTQLLGALAAAGERFDAVTMIELIEHLTPDAAIELLAQARGLLTPEGRLVVTTPNYRSLWPLIELGVNAKSPVNYIEQHINKYRTGLLEDHLEAAGYRDIRVKTVLGFAPFAAVLGLGVANAVHAVETGLRYLGIGNLLLATARP